MAKWGINGNQIKFDKFRIRQKVLTCEFTFKRSIHKLIHESLQHPPSAPNRRFEHLIKLSIWGTNTKDEEIPHEEKQSGHTFRFGAAIAAAIVGNS